MRPHLRTSLSVKLGALLAALLLAGCQDEATGIALGTVERDRVALTATAAEVVIALPVPQGSRVKKGDVLVRLDDQRERAQVAGAQAEVERARANLEKLRNGAREEELAAARAKVSGARASLLETEQTFERTKDLSSRGTVSKASYDTAVAKRDAAQASLKSAQEELRELENGARAEDLAMAEAELAAAQANLASLEKVLSDLTVVASRDGILDSLPWNLGERVTTGSPVAVVLAGDGPFARVHVPEPYRVKVKEGDHLKVKIDGVDQPLDGTVRWISSEPSFTPYYALNQEQRSRLMYLAEVDLPEAAQELPSGVPAQVLLP